MSILPTSFQISSFRTEPFEYANCEPLNSMCELLLLFLFVSLCQMDGIFECIAEHEHYGAKQNALFRFHSISIKMCTRQCFYFASCQCYVVVVLCLLSSVLLLHPFLVSFCESYRIYTGRRKILRNLLLPHPFIVQRDRM